VSDPEAQALVASPSAETRAAVYDVRTGQQWDLGHGQPQVEASVVKLDILETLLDRYRATDATLPDGCRSPARMTTGKSTASDGFLATAATT
jgi:hypothetical protein